MAMQSCIDDILEFLPNLSTVITIVNSLLQWLQLLLFTVIQFVDLNLAWSLHNIFLSLLYLRL